MTMSEPKGSRRYGVPMRPWFWWWRLPTAVGMAILAVRLPTSPSVFDTPVVDHTLFALAAVLLVIASFSPPLHLGWRVAAMAFAVTACEGRAAILVLSSSTLTSNQIVSGVVTWSVIAWGVVVATVVTDRVRALSR